MRQPDLGEIMPLLGPAGRYVTDDSVNEIHLNADGTVRVERDGRKVLAPEVYDPMKLEGMARRIARVFDLDFGPRTPLLEVPLADGSRVAAAHGSVSLDGTFLSIRKFQFKRYTVDELVAVGTLTEEQRSVLVSAVLDDPHRSVMLSGSTSSGKTTLLSALASLISPEDRILVIEDAPEIQLSHPHVVRLHARKEVKSNPGRPGIPEVSIGDCLAHALRHAPDRIIVGEMRGATAWDFLQALNTGHGGSLSTIHATSAEDAPDRVTSCVCMCGLNLPLKYIRMTIKDHLPLWVHCKKNLSTGKRYVSQMRWLTGYDDETGRFQFKQACGDR